MDDLFRDAAKTTRDSIMKTVPALLPVIVMLVGFIVYGYAIQNDACFTYDDWRRPFSLYSFSALFVAALLMVLYYALMVKVQSLSTENNNFATISVRIMILVIGSFLASALFLPTINLMSKNRNSFERIDVGASVKHPKQKNWTVFVAALLIYGTIIPLGKELGDFISGNTILDQYLRT